jgi:hypothetical protein
MRVAIGIVNDTAYLAKSDMDNHFVARHNFFAVLTKYLTTYASQLLSFITGDSTSKSLPFRLVNLY